MCVWIACFESYAKRFDNNRSARRHVLLTKMNDCVDVLLWCLLSGQWGTKKIYNFDRKFVEYCFGSINRSIHVNWVCGNLLSNLCTVYIVQCSYNANVLHCIRSIDSFVVIESTWSFALREAAVVYCVHNEISNVLFPTNICSLFLRVSHCKVAELNWTYRFRNSSNTKRLNVNELFSKQQQKMTVYLQLLSVADFSVIHKIGYIIFTWSIFRIIRMNVLIVLAVLHSIEIIDASAYN